MSDLIFVKDYRIHIFNIFFLLDVSPRSFLRDNFTSSKALLIKLRRLD